MVKPFLSVLSTVLCNKGHMIRNSPLPSQKINQCSQPCNFGLLTPLSPETKQVAPVADIETTNIAVDLFPVVTGPHLMVTFNLCCQIQGEAFLS